MLTRPEVPSEQMIEIFREKVHRVVDRPKGLSVWDYGFMDLGKTEMETILHRSPETLDYWEYQVVLSASFRESLYYLPYALRYMAEMKPGYEECTLRIMFLFEKRGQLARLGLWEDAVDSLEAVFDIWLRRFRVIAAEQMRGTIQRPLPLESVLLDGDARDDYLDKLLACGIGSGGNLLADRILSVWTGQPIQPTASGHLLDMCARSATGSRWHCGILYDNDDVRRFLADRKRVAMHVELAKSAWEEHGVPGWYMRRIVQATLLYRQA